MTRALQLLSDRVMWRSQSRVVALLESLALTLCLALLGRWLVPADPLLMAVGFPFLVLGPLLCGLQHGLLGGLASALGLTLASRFVQPGQTGFGADPGMWALGCVLCGSFAGLMRDSLDDKRTHLLAEFEDASAGLSALSVRHQLLQASHAELQVQLSAEQWSLMGANDDTLRAVVQASSAEALSAAVLALLAAQGRVESATLLTARDSQDFCTLGVLGKPPSVSEQHPLVRAAIAERKLISVPRQEMGAGDTEVLAAIPFVTPGREVVGVAVIHRMPFIAFEPTHLRRLLLLASNLAGPMSERLKVFEGLQVRSASRPPTQPANHARPSRVRGLSDFAAQP